MNHPARLLPSTRREFLRVSSRGIGLLAFSRFAPAFLVQSTLASAPLPEKDRSILVLVQLAGGNDGLNTIVPFADSNYYRLRPTLALAKRDVLPLTDTLGLHPACGALHALFQEGQLGLVQNVGYPNPNRSHFRSAEIWETASASDAYSATGWVGRFLDNACAGSPAADTRQDPLAVHLTNESPQSFFSAEAHPTFGLPPRARGRRRRNEDLSLLEALASGPAPAADSGNGSFLRQTTMDALVTERRVERVLADYQPEARYPAQPFAQSLRNVAAMISAHFATRVYFVSLSGFDTHSRQAAAHQNLLRTLSEGLSAFQQDLRARRLDEQVLTMTFSEFGRRPAENESGGTDHGTAAPLFVMGSRLRGNLFGSPPALQVDRREDLRHSTDFRQVYATVLDRWLHCPAEAVLGRPFEPLSFV